MSPLGRGAGILQQRALARLYKELSVLDRSVLQNAMAKVEDMAVAGQRADSGQGHIANFVGRGKQDGRVDIALQGDSWAECLANLSQVNSPINAEHIGSTAPRGGEHMI